MYSWAAFTLFSLIKLDLFIKLEMNGASKLVSFFYLLFNIEYLFGGPLRQRSACRTLVEGLQTGFQSLMYQKTLLPVNCDRD